MADLSLDDYMEKKNFRVQIQNNTWNKGNGNTVGLTTKKNQAGPYGGGGQNRFQQNQNRGPSFSVTGLGNVKNFDARQKLGPKVKFDARERLQSKKPVDARQKISGVRGQNGNQNPGIRQRITGPGIQTQQNITRPGSGPYGQRQLITGPNVHVQQKVFAPKQQEGPTLTVKLGSLGADARKKIISLQSQKGTFDARSRINTKPQQQQQQVQSVPNPYGAGPTIIRNLNQQTGGGGPGGKGSKIQLTNSGLQVTRAIPSATISFEGSMLTVTKRTQDRARAQVVADEFSQDFEQEDFFQQDEYDDENFLELESVEEAKPKLFQIKKTIKTTPAPVQNSPKIVSATLKRKAPQVVPVQSSGPLKLMRPSGGAHIPVITPPKRAKMAAQTVVPMSRSGVKQSKVFQVKEEVEEQEVEEVEGDGQDVISPLQGYRVYVTNLHPVVNQDDIIELFGAIGALRKAKLIKQGVAEVVYVKKDDAVKAVQKYHNRELDGLPMQVKLLTSATATVKQPTPAPVETAQTDDTPKSGPLKLLKQPSAAAAIPSLRMQSDPDSNVELPLVHKALFKVGGQATSKPVTFTVKI